MSLDHHLDDATLLQYACGNLDEAFTVVVATHVAMCDTCRHAVRQAEELGGGVLEDAGTAELEVGSFEHLMLRIADQPDDIAPAATVAQASGDVPAPLVRHLGSDLGAVRWKSIAPGVRKHVIKQNSASKSSLYMLHIAPGMAVPEHGHGGSELTLILSGSYTDVFGTFRRGDIADLDEHVEHQPIVDGDLPCICLVATEAPTRFKGFFSRLLQPLTGI